MTSGVMTLCPTCSKRMVQTRERGVHCPEHPWQKRKPRARIIRGVRVTDKAGRPKRARDRNLHVDMERVTARSSRTCCAERRCKSRGYRSMNDLGVILPGEEYAKVFANEGRPKIIKGRMIYSPRDYHFECVPEAYRPLVRFLKPGHKPCYDM